MNRVKNKPTVNQPPIADTLPVTLLGDDVLRGKMARVQNINADTRLLASRMFNTLIAERGVGLAAPQVGVLERLFVVCIEGFPPYVFINPSIIETSEEMCLYEEGCLSIPGVWASVKRPRRVTVQAWNERGRPFTLQADGLLARVIQHEYDHLDGVLFIDRLSPVKRERLLAKYQKLTGKKK
jgi:peptide deformylase